MLIKSSNIVLRATIINHASSTRLSLLQTPTSFKDYRIRNHCPIVPLASLVFLSQNSKPVKKYSQRSVRRILYRENCSLLSLAVLLWTTILIISLFYDSRREERNSLSRVVDPRAGFHRGVKLSLANFKGDARNLYLGYDDERRDDFGEDGKDEIFDKFYL